MRLEATDPLSNSEQVRRARFAATPTASPQGPAPITARSSINEPLSRHFDDLIAMRTHAHVLDGCVCKVLEPVQVGLAGGGRSASRRTWLSDFCQPGSVSYTGSTRARRSTSAGIESSDSPSQR